VILALYPVVVHAAAETKYICMAHPDHEVTLSETSLTGNRYANNCNICNAPVIQLVPFTANKCMLKRTKNNDWSTDLRVFVFGLNKSQRVLYYRNPNNEDEEDYSGYITSVTTITVAVVKQIFGNAKLGYLLDGVNYKRSKKDKGIYELQQDKPVLKLRDATLSEHTAVNFEDKTNAHMITLLLHWFPEAQVVTTMPNDLLERIRDRADRVMESKDKKKREENLSRIRDAKAKDRAISTAHAIVYECDEASIRQLAEGVNLYHEYNVGNVLEAKDAGSKVFCNMDGANIMIYKYEGQWILVHFHVDKDLQVRYTTSDVGDDGDLPWTPTFNITEKSRRAVGSRRGPLIHDTFKVTRE